MTVLIKGANVVKVQCKLNKIPMDFKLAQEAANILKPKFKRLRIPQGTVTTVPI